MSNDKTYNGWYNWATWAANIWMDGYDFIDVVVAATKSVAETEGFEDVATIFTNPDTSSAIIEQVTDCITQAFYTAIGYDNMTSIQQEFCCVSEINFREIAEHYVNVVAEDVDESVTIAEFGSRY